MMKIEVRVLVTLTKECHDLLVANSGIDWDETTACRLPSGDYTFDISWPTFCQMQRLRLDGESDSDMILRVMARVDGKVH